MLVVVLVVAVVVAVATYVTWLAGRLDRLHARVDGARAALDAQLVRRAAAAAALAERARHLGRLTGGQVAALVGAARVAAQADGADREAVENDLSRTLHGVLRVLPLADRQLQPALHDLAVAVDRVGMARRFFNDAVRDTRSIRERRVVRSLRLAGRAPLPAYFEIDDSAPAALVGGAERK